MTTVIETTFPQLDQDLRRVRRELHDTLGAADRRLRRPLGHLLVNSGRMFRPSLALIAYYLYATPDGTPADDDVIKAAAAVECLHIATLYHDDVIDDATLRRGVPALHAQYGRDSAILAGDFLLGCCMSLASSLSDTVASVIAETLREMCNGQMLEMVDTFNVFRDEESYFAAINGKTASLLAASASVGALTGRAPRQSLLPLATYARHLGLAFQIWDDVRDIRATDDTGKDAGKDIENGVYTLPVIYGMRRAPDELAELLTTPAAGRLARIRRLLEDTGALDAAVRTASYNLAEAFAAADQLTEEWPRADIGERLRGLARALIPEFEELRAD